MTPDSGPGALPSQPMDRIAQNLADNIYVRRRLQGMSAEEVAEGVGVLRQTVKRWETGASRPGTDYWDRISRVLGCKVGDLLDAPPVARSAAPTAPRYLAHRARKRSA